MAVTCYFIYSNYKSLGRSTMQVGRPCPWLRMTLPQLAGAPVGAVGSQTTALLHAARRGWCSIAAVQAEPATAGVPGVAPTGNAHQTQPEPRPEPPKRSAAHYLWAVLIARIYEVFPLLCPMCGGQMRLIAFITEGAQTKRILEHINMDSQAPLQ